MPNAAIAIRPENGIQLKNEFDVTEVIEQVKKIQNIMTAVMRKDEHYGVIPGTNKPTLLKPGAEKLCFTFRLEPEYESTDVYDGNHLTVKSKCTLYHIPTGARQGSGEGSCSTKESKYAYRDSQRKCPKCETEAIIKGKDFTGKGLPAGWLCFAKKGGCGAKFKDGDTQIESQVIGRIQNPDIPDQYNTILKMANKRSLIAAVLNATAASDIFTQDLEDLPETVVVKEQATKVPIEGANASAIFDGTGEVIVEHDKAPAPGKTMEETLDEELTAIIQKGDKQKAGDWFATRLKDINKLPTKTKQNLMKCYKQFLGSADAA